ncbi:hypothetical protein M407DRAFT_10667 [Tulasnella calospora MUT 4182]|uniref:Uncharacterized protein n=1 Tax=Tulasnella calospora MUT 4182 TaxID=1051891 RepID=A0A0C3LHL9_9AGAM|nr:hypothetical protein M407DRAFT_10667 [Tulasnella calospora MUT 4182]
MKRARENSTVAKHATFYGISAAGDQPDGARDPQLSVISVDLKPEQTAESTLPSPSPSDPSSLVPWKPRLAQTLDIARERLLPHLRPIHVAACFYWRLACPQSSDWLSPKSPKTAAAASCWPSGFVRTSIQITLASPKLFSDFDPSVQFSDGFQPPDRGFIGL